MNTNWMKARQTKYGAYLTVYILVVLAIVAGVNWLANQNNKSYDATSNKRFSLSDATKQTLKGLTHDINITDFDRTSAFDTARATLDRYKDQSSHIKVTYIDPEKKPEIARLAHVQSFGSIFVDNEATKKHEEAKSMTEEEITGAIKRSMTNSVRTACFVTGSGEASITDTDREGYSRFKDLLDKNGIKTKELPLLQKAAVEKECTIVVVGGPTHDYIPPVRDALKKFVDEGGKTLIMFTPAIPDKTGAAEGEPELEKLVAGWGVTVANDLVYDVGPYSQVFGEAAPVVGHYESHPIGKEMGRSATVFPLSRSLDVKSGGGMEKLFESSDTSYEKIGLTPPIKLDPDKDKKGPFTLGAAGTVNGKARMVIIGSSSWVSNSALSYPTANKDLALNMMNWLTADESLISIPSKEPEDRRIMLSGRQMNMIALFSVIILPLVVILSGFGVWWKRR
jgi:ABC-type uncharacterized transport system involved in gliding motility auxiliary subunit